MKRPFTLAALALLLVVANPSPAATTAPPQTGDPATAASIRIIRVGICWALAALRSGAGTSDGEAAPDLVITPGREDEMARLLDRCGTAIFGTPEAQP